MENLYNEVSEFGMYEGRYFRKVWLEFMFFCYGLGYEVFVDML